MNKGKSQVVAFGVLAATLGHSAQAQEPGTANGNRLEEVVVTSSRVATPLREVGTSVSIVTEAQIRQLGFNTLQDVLRTQPAIAASNTGGVGAPTPLRVRGEEGFRTRTFIDGIDISDVSGVQVSPQFQHILSSGVSRVEILRGPQGLMYGADSGGIINIMTARSQEAFAGSLGLETGRFAMRQLSAAGAGSTGSLDYGFNAQDYSTDGFNARADDTALGDNDGYENTTVHGTLGWQASEALRFEAVLRNTDSEGGFDNCFGALGRSDDCDNRVEQLAWRVGARLSLAGGEHQIFYSGNTTDREFFTDGLAGFATQGELERISYLGEYRVAEAVNVVFGFDLQSEELDSGATFRSRDQDGYYLELQSEPVDRLFVTAGLRYDDNEDFGEHNSYRLSAAYIIPASSGELKLRGAYGTGFRAPSLFEVAYNLGPFARPPASAVELSEEQSAGYDIGLVWALDNGSYLEATYFDQSVSDEILFDPVGFTGYLQGVGEFDSTGIELVASVALPGRLTLNANYTFNESENAAGEARFRRPEHLANLNVQWRSLDERLMLGLQLRALAHAIDLDGSKLDDYEVLTANASWRLARGLQVYGRVENLLDEDYEEVPGFNTPGASAYIGLRYEL